MQEAAHVFAQREHRSVPGRRILQCESGYNENKEAGQQRSVLNPEAQRHTRDKGVIELPSRNDLGSPDDEIVQEHATDDGEDHAEIEAANPADCLAAHVGGERRVDVNLGSGKFLGYAWMALAAGPREIGPIDGGARIARREDAVRTMATRAVGNHLRSEAGRQSVITSQISCLTAALDAELL